MLKETTIEATFVCVSVHAHLVESDPSTIRSTLLDEVASLDGFVVPNTPILVVGFEDHCAPTWVANVCKKLGRETSAFSFGVDRGIAVRGSDFLTDQPFVKSDAMERAMDLAHAAAKGTIAIGLDATVAQPDWDANYDLTASPNANFRCKTGALLATDTVSVGLIPEHSVIGRDNLLSQLYDTTLSRNLIWITGSTGVGKTAVAAQFASWWRGTLKREVAWLDGKRFKTLDDVVFELARQMGVHLNHPRELKVLGRALEQRSDLLVVTDQIDAISPEIEQLWREANLKSPRLIATARTAPAGGDQDSANLEVPALPDAAVVAIIAARLNTHLNIDDLNRLAVACSGRPALAQWAAAQCSHHSVHEVISELTGERPSSTVTGMFENTFSFSWTRLNPAQRNVVQFLSVFEGGAPMSALSAIQEFDATKHMNSVDFRTFVKIDDDGRAQLFPQSAKFVETNTPAEQEHIEAHAEYFVKWSAELADELDGPNESEAVASLKGDLVNFRKALSTRWGHTEDVSRIARTFEKGLRTMGTVPGLTEITDQILEHYRDFPPLFIAVNLVRTRQAIAQGQPEEAYARLDAIDTVISQCPQYRSEYCLTRGIVLQNQSRITDALEWGNRAVDTATNNADRWRTQTFVGLVHANLGNIDRALQVLRDILVGCDIPSSRARVCRSIGSLLADDDQLDEAERYFQYVFSYCAEIGNLRDIIEPIFARARATFRAGRHQEALERFAEGVSVAKRVNNRFYETSAMVESAFFHALSGDLIRAIDLVDRASNERPSTASSDARRHRTCDSVRQNGLSRTRNRSAFESRNDPRRNRLHSPRRPFPFSRGVVHSARALMYFEAGDVERMQEEIESALRLAGELSSSDFKPKSFLGKTLNQELSRFRHGEAEVVLEVSADGRWFQRIGESRVDITRRAALKRLVVGLVERHMEEPGSALSLDDAFEIGWPGEKALEQSKVRRVYSTVNRLRNLGFQEIVTSDGGYFIDPAVTVRTVDETAA